MGLTELPAVKETDEDYEAIEAEILRAFRDELYRPLLKIVSTKENPATLQNSLSDVLRAISSGKIYFYRGQFKGRLDSKLSRELKKLGAVWDRKQGCWKIPLSLLPTSLRMAIRSSQDRWEKAIEKLDEQIRKIVPEKIADAMDLEKRFDLTIFKLDRSINKTLKGISLQPDLTPEQRKQIAEEYTKNMRLYIKDWTQKEIVELREKVQKRAMQGQRYEGLADQIQKSYGVSRAKAKFLARQETNLMMTKLKETRYTDAGVTKYKWCCVAGSANSPVRPMHKKLEGKIFSWDNPPIVNEKGDRKNPGEDYGCRCFARPVVEF